MNDARRQELTHGPDPQKLTPEEIAEGWHWCRPFCHQCFSLDWDCLMIGPGTYEWDDGDECPYCDHKIPKS